LQTWGVLVILGLPALFRPVFLGLFADDRLDRGSRSPSCQRHVRIAPSSFKPMIDELHGRNRADRFFIFVGLL
jgi:hypothetical protein